MKRLLWLCPLLLVVATVLAADTPKLVYMDDIGQWSAEMYAGNPNIRNFAPGPKLQTALSGIIVFDSKGNGYVPCETFVAVVTRDGQAQLLTGQPGLAGNTDGPPGVATFNHALDIALADDNTLYVADAATLTLRKIARTGGAWVTTTVAGQPGVKGHRDGKAGESLLTSVFDSVTVDEADGAAYLFDGDWLRRFKDGVLTTLNPEGGTGYVNGPVAKARFAHSQGRQHGLTCDGRGNLYVADKVNMAIRKVDLKAGAVSTFAGTAPGVEKTRPRDGKLLDARFHPGGGPNMIFYSKKLDAFICRSDDETVIRIIKGDEVCTFGPHEGKNTALTGPWQDCVGGTVCGVDAEGGVYIQGSGCIRVVRKNRP